MRAAVAQAPRHLEPVDARHHHVEHDEVRGERLHGVERLAAVVRHLHGEVLVAQRHGHEVGDALLVVDDEDAGARRVPLSIMRAPSVCGARCARMIRRFPENS